MVEQLIRNEQVAGSIPAVGSMKILSALLVGGLLTIFLSSCAEDNFVGERPVDSGKVLTVTEAVQPQQLGRAIRVRGTVRAVCQDEGCWMTITDGTSYLRMTFLNEKFTVSMELDGNVIVEGTIYEEIYEKEAAQAVSETIGYTPDEVEMIDGDHRLPIMTTTGVLFLD